MDASIREATDTDIEAIQQVARASWHAAHDDVIGVDPVDSVLDEWYDSDSLAESIARDDGTFLVADADDDVVGFAQGVLGDEGEPAWLVRIYVHPDHWGDGIGSELLARIESWLRDEGAEHLRLAVMADNDVGNAFYETHGYAVVEERDEEVFGVEFEDYVREKAL